MAKPKKKGKKGLIIGLAVGFVLLSAGGVVGAAFMGLINIPGLTPKKQTASLYGEGDDLYGEGTELATNTEDPGADSLEERTEEIKPEEIDEPEIKVTTPPEPEEPETDPEVGAKKLAKVWNEIKPDKLAPIVAEYKEEDLARVLTKMDASKVAKLMAELDPKLAARVSKEMEAQGSVLEPPTT